MTQFYRVKNMEGAGPLRTASGRKYFVVLIDRNNAILDQNGFVRLLYLDQEEYKEKPLNLILAPRSENQAKIASFIGDWLLPFGAAEMIDKSMGDEKGFNIVKFVAGALAASLLIKPILDAWQSEHSAYYDVATKELVILDPIKIHKSNIEKI